MVSPIGISPMKNHISLSRSVEKSGMTVAEQLPYAFQGVWKHPLHAVPLKCDNQKTSPDIAKCHEGRGGDKPAPGWELPVSHSNHESRVWSLWRFRPEAQEEEHFSLRPPGPLPPRVTAVECDV